MKSLIFNKFSINRNSIKCRSANLRLSPNIDHEQVFYSNSYLSLTLSREASDRWLRKKRLIMAGERENSAWAPAKADNIRVNIILTKLSSNQFIDWSYSYLDTPWYIGQSVFIYMYKYTPALSTFNVGRSKSEEVNFWSFLFARFKRTKSQNTRTCCTHSFVYFQSGCKSIHFNFIDMNSWQQIK